MPSSDDAPSDESREAETTTTPTPSAPTEEEVALSASEKDGGGGGDDKKSPEENMEEGVEISAEDSKKNMKKAAFKEGDEEEEAKTPEGGGGDDDDEEAQVVSPAASKEDDNNKQKKKVLSPVYYCPITKKIFQDPVVTPDGITYERAAIIEEKGEEITSKLYPNRALKTIIDEELSMLGDSLRSKLLRMQKSMKSNLSLMLEKSVIPSKEHRVLPDSYYCPITYELMTTPMIDPEGNSYDRRAIKKWIKSNHDSPLTRTQLSFTQLYPNLALKELLNEEKEKSDESIHPSIRRWKEQKEAEGGGGDNDEESSDEEEGQTSGRTRIPVTREELERLERRRKCQQITSLAICITFLLVFIYYPGYLFAFVIIYWMYLCCTESRDNYAAQQQASFL